MIVAENLGAGAKVSEVAGGVVGMAQTDVGGRHDEERAKSRADCLGFHFCAGEGRRKGTAARYLG